MSDATLVLWAHAAAGPARLRQARAAQGCAGAAVREFPWGFALRLDGDDGSPRGVGPAASRTLRRLAGVDVGGAPMVALRDPAHGDAGDPWDAVVRLASLVALAEPGELLVDRRALPDWLPLASAGAQFDALLDGVAAPVPLAPISLRRLHERAGAPSTPYLGRARERAVIAGRLAEVAAGGAGRTLVLAAPPGLGKSTMAGAVLDEARAAGLLAVELHASPDERHDARPALARFCGELLDALGVDPAARSTWLAELPPFDERRLVLAELLDLPLGREERLALGQRDAAALASARREALTAWLLEEASRRPLALVAEDVHWAPPELVALLQAVAAASSSAPLLCLLTTRLDDDPTAGDGWRDVERLRLAPLDDAAALALAREVALAYRTPWRVQVGRDLSDTQLVACVARAGGSPLYLVQLLHQQATDDAGASGADLPALLDARRAALPDAVQRLLGAAACAGTWFDEAALAPFADDPGDLLRQAQAAGIVAPARGGWRFAHALLRDAVLRTLSPAARRSLHHALADAAPPGSAARVEHLLRAGAAGGATAALALADARAAEGHTSEAIGWLDRALRSLDDAADRARVRVRRARLYAALGDGAASLADAREAEAEAGAGRGATDARMAALGALRLLGRTAELTTAIAALTEALGPGARPVELATLAYYQGCAHFARGEVAACQAAHERAVALSADDPDDALRAEAWSGLGDARYARGDFAGALEAFTRAVERAQRARVVRAEVGATHMASITMMYLGRADDSHAWAVRGHELATWAGDARAAYFATTNRALCAFLRGAYDEAAAWFDDALGRAAGSGAPGLLGMGLAFASHVDVARGDRARARARADRAMELARELGPGFFGGVALGGRVAAATPEEVAGLLALAPSWVRADGISHNAIYLLLGALPAARRAGDPSALAGLRAVLAPWASPARDVAVTRVLRAWLAAPTDGGGDGAALAEAAREARACGLAAFSDAIAGSAP